MEKTYFKKWSVNDILAFSSASRAQSGFGFIERCLDEYPNGTLRDESVTAPYSRQIDILISYNFELILDAALFICSSKSNESEILNEVKGLHYLDKKWDKITDTTIKDILEIKDITLQKDKKLRQYLITLNSNRTLLIEDFLDIRYDIRDFRGNKDHLRQIKIKANLFDKITKFSYDTSSKIMKFLEEKYIVIK